MWHKRPSLRIRWWLKAMAKQGVDIRRVSVKDYAVHLLLMGDGR